MEYFKTIQGEAFAEFIEKRSKFLCYAKHVESRDEAEEYISDIKSKHWDAKHNVYAYRVRVENFSKSSDDGEPQGTAGMPVLSRLEKMSIVDTVIVVTRYFGGILLGAGGLTRAYSHAAGLVLASSEIAEMKPCVIARIRVTYEVFDKIKKATKNLEAIISDCTYTNFVEANISVEEHKFDRLQGVINELSCGKAEMFVKKRDLLCMIDKN